MDWYTFHGCALVATHYICDIGSKKYLNAEVAKCSSYTQVDEIKHLINLCHFSLLSRVFVLLRGKELSCFVNVQYYCAIIPCNMFISLFSSSNYSVNSATD